MSAAHEAAWLLLFLGECNHFQNRACVAAERADGAAAVQVPEAHGAVVAA